MVHFNLRPEARDLVVRILENYLGDLRIEVGDTEDFNYRSELKAEEMLVREILDALTHAQASPQAPLQP